MKNKTWILLRGLCRESRHWGDYLAHMQNAFPQDQVIAVDLPGMGSRYNEASPWTISGLVESVRAELTQRNLKSPYSLFAVSLGGMVALKWAESYQHEVERFCVVNVSDAHSSIAKRLRLQIWPDFLRAPLMSSAQAREAQILKCISNSPENAAKALPDWARFAQEHPLKLSVALAQLMAARSFRAKGPVAAEGLFLVGLGDRLVDPSCSFRISEIYRRKIITHPWGGHDLTLDDPEWVTSRVVEMVAN